MGRRRHDPLTCGCDEQAPGAELWLDGVSTVGGTSRGRHCRLTVKQDRLRGRLRMLNGALEGRMERWTLPLEKWQLVRDVILEVVDDADREEGDTD